MESTTEKRRKCMFCKRFDRPAYVHLPEGLILEFFRLLDPRFSTRTRFCSICVDRASRRTHRIEEKRLLMDRVKQKSSSDSGTLSSGSLTTNSCNIDLASQENIQNENVLPNNAPNTSRNPTATSQHSFDAIVNEQNINISQATTEDSSLASDVIPLRRKRTHIELNSEDAIHDHENHSTSSSSTTTTVSLPKRIRTPDPIQQVSLPERLPIPDPIQLPETDDPNSDLIPSRYVDARNKKVRIRDKSPPTSVPPRPSTLQSIQDVLPIDEYRRSNGG